MDGILRNQLHVLKQFQPLFPAQRTQFQEKVLVTFREPYILRGYRLTNKPWHYYLVSLFLWHNETLNIWTHLISFIYILLHTITLCEKYDIFNSSEGAVVLGYSIGALSLTSFSTIAHLFHSKSLRHHYVFFMMDYFGVSLYSLGCGILTIYRFCPEKSFQTLQTFYLPLHLILCYNNFLSISTAKLYFFGIIRKCLTVSACIASTISMLCPLLCKYYECFVDTTCHISSLNHLGLMYVFLFLSTIAYLAHQPEMSNVGMCDIIGHSHQWFHIFVFCTILAQYNAMEKEIDMNNGVISDVHLSTIIVYFVLLLGLNSITFLFLQPALNRKVADIENTNDIKQR